MKPKKLGRNTKCITCTEKIQDLQALDCQLCLKWECLSCSGTSTELFKFLQDNQESLSILCTACKEEIPGLRELQIIKQKQTHLEDQLKNLKTDAGKTKLKVEGIEETQGIQGGEILRHDSELKDIFKRLEEVESALVINNTGSDEGSYANRLRTPATNTNQIQTMVRTQINEQSEIEKIRCNLVISGIAENANADEDRMKVIELLEEQLGITADISDTERIGKPRQQKEGEAAPLPRLLKLKFVTQRSRKEVLSKATTLRNSNVEHVKTKVYIRPDMTKLQLEESKNLRELLQQTRASNPGRIYKIFRNKIIEVNPAAVVPPPEPQEQQPTPPPETQEQNNA